VPSPRSKQEVEPTILLVEDHFATRWSTAEYLRRQGYKVLEAVDMKEALVLATAGTRIDVVFSEVQLDGEQTGDELAQWFGKHRPSVGVLLTSGADGLGPSPLSEPRSFVRKPYDLKQVEQLLRSMIRRP